MKLKQAMDEEKERAEWEKHEKRIRKLRKGGHDTSHYEATFEGIFHSTSTNSSPHVSAVVYFMLLLLLY